MKSHGECSRHREQRMQRPRGGREPDILRVRRRQMWLEGAKEWGGWLEMMLKD